MKKKNKKTSAFVKEVYEECSFLKDFGGMTDNADALSESTSVQDLEDSKIDDDDNDHETIHDYEDDEHSSNGLSYQEELSNQFCESLENKYKKKTLAKNNIKDLNLLDQDFPRRSTKANSKETTETNSSLTHSLKALHELVENNKKIDRVKSKSKIICKYLEDLPKSKQPGCLRRILKIFKKYELK